MTIPSLYYRRQQRRARQSFVLDTWTGLNDDSNNSALADTDLRKATNLCLYRASLIGGRFGSHRDPYGAALNGGVAVTGLFDYKATKDTVNRPIAIAGNKIYAEDASTDPSGATDITGACAIQTGQNNIWSGAVFKDALVLTQRGGSSGTHVPLKITSAGNAVPLPGWFANGRTAEYMHTQFGYMIAAGFDRAGAPVTAQNSMAVYASELQDAETWLESGIIDKIGGISVYGDEFVTGLFRHRDFLMIGTNKRIYPVVYTGDITALWAVQRPLDVGLAGQHSVISINGEFTFFMDPQGNIHAVHEVARGFGAIGVQSISRKIKNYISGLSRSMNKYTTSAYLSERGWCVWAVASGAGATAKNELLVLDINNFPLDAPDHRAATFFRWTGVDPNVVAVMTRDSSSVSNASEPSTTGEQFLYAGSKTGWVRRFTDSISYDEADGGVQTPISTEMSTKFYDFGQPESQKSIVEIRWNMEPAQVAAGPNVAIEYDFAVRRSATRTIDMSANLASNDLLGSTFVLGTSLLGGGTRVSPSRDYFRVAGKNCSVAITRALTGMEQWRLQQMELVVELRGEVPQSVGTV